MSVDAEELIRSGARFYESFQERRVLPLIRSAAPPAVAEPIIYSLSAPGKRFRPLLLMLCAGVLPESNGLRTGEPEYTERVLLSAAALEAIHTYSLIHDDLPSMDDDDLRRGRPSCHVAYGEWAAVLAGDGLNTLAFRLLAEIGDFALAGRLTFILSDAAGIRGMVGGQALDLQAEKGSVRLPNAAAEQNPGPKPPERLPHSAWLLDEIHERKTAALIAAACEMGALLAGVESPEDRAAHARFGLLLGLLFQISDDILDELGSTTELGKTAGQDRAHGKLTYPALHGIERSRMRANELLAELLELAVTLPSRGQGKNSTREHLEALCRFTGARTH